MAFTRAETLFLAMGAYMSEPITEKLSTDGESNHLRYGASSMQGWRVNQEDAHNCIHDFDESTSFFAVYDGHGGHEVATYCSDKFPDFLKHTEAYRDGDYKKALRDAFLGFDATITDPEVILHLKSLAGVNQNDDDEEEDEDGEAEDDNMLYQEATMPIDQVIEKYQLKMTPNEKVPVSLPLDKCGSSGGEGSSSCQAAGSSALNPIETNVTQSIETELCCKQMPESSSNSHRRNEIMTTASSSNKNKIVESKDTSSNNKSITKISESLKKKVIVTSRPAVRECDLKIDPEVVVISSGESEPNIQNEPVGSEKPKKSVNSSKQNTSGAAPSSLPSKNSESKVTAPSSVKSKSSELQSKAATAASSSKSKSSEPDAIDNLPSSENTNSKANGDINTNTSNLANGDAIPATVSAKGKSLVKKAILAQVVQANVKNLRARDARQLYSKLLQFNEESDSDDDNDETYEEKGTNSSSSDENDDTNDDYSTDADGEGGDDDEESSDYTVDEDDDEFTRNMTEEPGSDSGCTAVVSLLHGNDLYVANAGDSRCILSKNGRAFDMSVDHKPEDQLELDRVIKAGGRVSQDGRVNGGLNLSRAIGDHAYKQNKELPDYEQMIIALPDIQVTTINPAEDEFMVIACDGIWNYMSSQEVVEFVRPRLVQDGKPAVLSKICEEMFDHCLAPHTMGDGTGCDNMTAIIVQFKSNMNKRPASPISTDSKRLKTDDTNSIPS